MKKRYILSGILLIVSLAGFAQITVTDNNNGTQLSQIITGTGVTISNVTMNCPTGAAGSFTCNNCSLGLDSGIVLTSGYVDLVPGPNNSDAISGANGGSNDPDLDNLIGSSTEDACTLEFDVKVLSDSLQFKYVFGSDEYPEYVCSEFNDVFGFFISGPGITGQRNIALIPNTNIAVAINSVNNGSSGTYGYTPAICQALFNGHLNYTQYYVDNGDGLTAPYNTDSFYIQYDGLTRVLTASAGGLQPCQKYHLKLAIADVGDEFYDSGVFIEANSLTSNAVVFDSVKTNDPDQQNALRGCVDGVFTLRFQKPVTTNTYVHYVIGGTAVNGTDYVQIPDSVHFPIGDSTAQILIQPIGSSTQDTTTVVLYLYNTCDTVPYDSATLLILDTLNLHVGPTTSICPGDSVQLTSTNASTYSWTPAAGLSATNIGNPIAAPLVTTTYLCTAHIGTCTIRDSLTITVVNPPPFSVDAGPDQANCSGGTVSFNAVVTGNPINGYPFVYYWTPSTGLSNDSVLNPVVTSATSSTYIIHVTSGNCKASDSVNVIVGNLSSSTSGTPASCFNSTDGTGTVTANGTAPYTYHWSNGATTQNASALAAGTNYVTVTDNVGCTVLDSVIVNAPPAIYFNTPTITDATCYGGNNGSISITATGGSGNFTYNWSNGNTGTTASGLSAGVNYVVTATDINSCSTDTTLTVSQPTQLTSPITKTDVSCNGGSNGTATITSSGGTSPYTYLWNNSSTSNPLTGLTTGNYSVTTTDNAGCSVSSTVTISQPAVLTAATTATNVSCYNGSNGTITLVVNGGTQPYSFLWNDNNSSQSRTGLAAGQYTVTVTDSHSCTDTASATVTQPAAPLALSITAVNTTCPAGNDGSLALTATGGTTPYNYAWSNGAATQNIASLTAGIYTVSVTDNASCSATASGTITSPPAIHFSLPAITDVTCFGGTDGSISITANGGTGAISYSWSNGSSTSTATGLTANTDYTVTATDANSCNADTTIQVGTPTQLTASVAVTNVSCFQGADGTATVTATGSVPPYSYLWSNSTAGVTATGLAAGTYFVTVTDSHNCSATSANTITEPLPLVATDSATGPVCTYTTDGTITTFANGGTNPYSYSLLANNSVIQNSSNGVFTGLAAGAYTIQITDAKSCVETVPVVLSLPAPDLFTVTVDPTSCYGTDYTDGAIHLLPITIINGPYVYAIDGGTPQYSGDFYNLGTGTYIVTTTNHSGCTTDSSIMVPQPAQGVASVLPEDTTIQLGETIQLQASLSPYTESSIVSYNWVPSAGLSCVDCPDPIVSSYSHINNYTVVITYNNGCTASTSARVIVLGQPPVFIPNSFSPNGDGNNDIFLIYGEGIKTVDLKIFNRWGELVFNSNNLFLGWDGTYKGVLQEPGVYVYEAKITFLDDRKTLRTGSITLIR